MHNYTRNKEIFDLKQRHVPTVKSLNNPNKNFFSDNYIVDIFMFTSSIISLILTTLVVYLFCKHKYIRTLVASLILHKIKEVEANSSSEETNSKCKTLAYRNNFDSTTSDNCYFLALQKIKTLQRI